MKWSEERRIIEADGSSFVDVVVECSLKWKGVFLG